MLIGGNRNRITTEGEGSMSWLVLDIETIAPTDHEMQIELDMIKPAANIKDAAKKKANVESQKKTAKNKAGLLDGAQLSCVGMMSEKFTVCFTSYNLDEKDLDALSNIGVILFQNSTEKGLLQSMNIFFETVGNDYKIITFNGTNFDLPKIRYRYARNGIAIPKQFGMYIKHYDLMHVYTKYYSQKKIPFIGMCEVVERIGILEDGKIIKGDSFQQMLDGGENLLATLYNILDLHLTNAIRLRLSV